VTIWQKAKNADQCIGIIGSGNRNFNEQYCLTAKRYAKEFDAPFLADYELRGTPSDAEKIYAILKRVAATNAAQ
jgi:protein involved in ribonucleotide reduction